MSNRVVELLINLKTKGASEVDKLISSIRGLDRTASSSGRGVNTLASNTEKASQSTGRLGKTAGELDNELKEINRSSGRAGEGLRKFERDTGRSINVTGQLQTSVNRLRNRMIGLAAAATAALAAFATVRGIKNTADELGLLSNAAERARVSTQELMAAEYAAGEIAGKTWQDMAGAFDTIGRRLARFADTGGGPAAAALERIENFDASKIVDKSAVDQLRELADAMKDMSSVQRQDILFLLGGKNLQDLSDSLKDSDDAFFELLQKAIDTDYVLSNLEVSRLNDLGGTISNVNQAFKVMRERYLAQLAPALKIIGEWFSRMTDEAAGFNKESGDLSRSLVRGFEGFLKVAKWTEASFHSLFWLIAKLGQGITTISGHIVNLWSNSVNTVIDASFGRLEAGLRLAGRISDTAKRLADDLANYKPQVNNNSDTLFQWAEDFEFGAEQALIKVYDALDRKIPNFSKELEIYLDEEESNRNINKGLEGLQNNADENPIDIIIQTEIDSAMRSLAEARQKIEADAQKSITRQRIRDMDHEQTLALKNLDAQKKAGEISSEEYYAHRLELEKEHNERVAEMRKGLIDLDIEAVRRQKKALENMLGDLEQGGAEYLDVVKQIEEAEARIKGLQFDAKNIGLATQYKNELLVIADTERERERLRKEAEQAEKESEEKRKEAAEEVAKQEKMVADLKLDLLRQTGNEAKAQIVELKSQYGDMLAELEGNSEGAQLIEKLLDMKTAQVELDEFKKQLEELRAAYELGEISRAEYNRGVEALTPDLNAAAIRTGNEEIIDSTKRMAEEYKNFGDTAYQVGEVVGNRFMGLTDGLHSVIMGTKSLKDAFHEMAAGVIADLMRMIIQQQIFNALQAASGAIGGGFGAALGSIGLNHTGGYVGAGSARRTVPMSIFEGATRYHTGGLIGADEVPIIAQKGEYMLDKYDIRNPKNGGNGATPAQGGGSGQAVNITNVVDSASIAGAMDTPDGRNAIVNVIRAERATIKSIL